MATHSSIFAWEIPQRAWQAIVHRVTKSKTWLSDLHSQYYFSNILHGNIEISGGTNNFLKTKQVVKMLFLLYHNSYFKNCERIKSMKMRCLHSLSCVQLFVAPWTLPRQVPLPIGFSRQKYWSGLPFPPPGDPLNLGIEPASLMSPALASKFFTTSAASEALIKCRGSRKME